MSQWKNENSWEGRWDDAFGFGYGGCKAPVGYLSEDVQEVILRMQVWALERSLGRAFARAILSVKWE